MSSEINIEPFEKAVASLSDALDQKWTVLVQDATIQRFEYTFELSWKLLKRYFKVNNNIDLFNIKEIFREAGKQKLIDHVENWFEYLEARNLTSHTYDHKIAEKVYEKARLFEKDARLLLKKMNRLIDS
ncbi:MAG: nucleotidyltransferase substrate binding protein [Deltaproteobacteria bacterium]|nr:nucleotidyltransferase substrate binding protein [Deltaproteobacteria bacterium]